MKAPGEKQIIQIVATSYCDLACSNCTQLIAQQSRRYHMSVANFRRAVESLVGWTGIVGVFGGNPCLHPEFPALCQVMRELLPRERRGLWTNRLFGHGAVVKETFGYLNLVVHNDHAAAEEMRAAGLSPVHGDGKEAWHSPILVALQDVVHDRAQRRALIEACDINLHWSGAIDQDEDGSLRTWYCEVASSMARAYGHGTGLPLVNGWWKNHIEAWAMDIETYCNMCGVPAKLLGHRDNAETDDYSETHEHLIQLRPRRRAELYASIPSPETRATVREVTDYMRLKGE